MSQESMPPQALEATGGDNELSHLVEDFSVYFERLNFPRMAGRILGWLIICDPPEQTMQEIAKQLHASMGSISTMTRLLGQVGVIERVTLPGDRRVHFRVCQSAWTRTVEEQLEQTRNLLEIAERGIAALGPSSLERLERLEIVRRYASFYLEQQTRVIALWDELSQTYGRTSPR